MERQRSGRVAALILLSLCALVLLFGMGSARRGEEGRPRLEEARGLDREAPQGRDPASIDDLEDSVRRAAALARSEQWQAAREAAGEIKERWVSFKPAMRANAGERMWRTSDTDDFQAAMERFRESVEARDREKALESAETMLTIIDNYNDDREGS